MGYVEQSLSSGERIILKARLHWGMFINPLLGMMTAFLFLLLSAVPFLLPYKTLAGIGGFQLSESDYSLLQPLAGICCGGIALLYLLVTSPKPAFQGRHILSTEFAVTNKRVIGKSGLLRRKSLEVMLAKIESVGVDEPFWGRILNSVRSQSRAAAEPSSPFRSSPTPWRCGCR